jgi:hypothetical protein
MCRIEKCHGCTGSIRAVQLIGRETKKPARLALCGLLNITSYTVKLNRGGEDYQTNRPSPLQIRILLLQIEEMPPYAPPIYSSCWNAKLRHLDRFAVYPDSPTLVRGGK